MYLINIASDELNKIEKLAFSSLKSKLIYTSLIEDKLDICVSLNKEDMSLIYSFNISQANYKFILYPDKTFKLDSYYDKDDESIKAAIALYIYNHDKNKSEEELAKEYSYLYPLICELALLDKDDIPKYYENKIALTKLVKNIKIKSKPNIKAKFKSLIIDTDYDKISNEKDISIRYIDEFNVTNDVSLYIFFRDFDKNNSSINKYSFDNEDLLFLLELKECYYKISRDQLGHYHSNFTSEYLSDFLTILKYYPRRHIIIKNTIYRINHEIKEINTYISTTCKIVSDLKINEFIISNDLLTLSLDKSNMILYLSKFRNIQEKILTEFLINNKDFSSSLYKNEFISSVVPYLDKSIPVSEEILKQSEKFLTEIDYYIELTESENKIHSQLSIYTKYILNGLEVSEDVYKKETLNDDYLNFINILNKLNLPQLKNITNNDEIYGIISTDISKLNSCCRLFLSDNLKRINTNSTFNFKIITSSGIDWFKTTIDSSTFSQDELKMILEACKKQKKFIKFKDSIFNLNSTINRYELSLFDKFEIDSTLTGKKLPLYQAVKLNEYKNSNDLSLTDNLKSFFNTLRDYSSININVDKNTPLRNYQLDAVKWLEVLYKYHLSGILADDMGLGKSLELIAFLETKDLNKPLIIVSPKSIIYNWQNEFSKWNSKKKIFVVDGDKNNRQMIYKQVKNKDNTVLIISYESLRIDIDILSNFFFSYLVLDEGHNIANVFAKKTLAVKMINADYKLVLTGTPIQNSLVDLYSIFDFLLPGYFDEYKNFIKTYTDIDNDFDENKRRLELLIKPFVLRRKKDEVLNELPPKVTQEIYITLDEKSSKIYQAFLSKAKNSFISKSKSKIEVLADITRLRQISIDPSSFLDDYKIISSKLEEALNMIGDLVNGNHKVLLFSSFVTILNHLEKLLIDKGINTSKIIGETTAKKRIELADKFNYEQDIKVMLVSLKAGGTGLNLIGADSVIILDPWWNIASENQASDRAYRIGQNKKVTVFRLISKGTIEERVLELQRKKEELASIISDSNSEVEYSNDDISFLLGVYEK